MDRKVYVVYKQQMERTIPVKGYVNKLKANQALTEVTLEEGDMDKGIMKVELDDVM